MSRRTGSPLPPRDALRRIEPAVAPWSEAGRGDERERASSLTNKHGLSGMQQRRALRQISPRLRASFDPTIPPKRKRMGLSTRPRLGAYKGGTSNGSTRLFAVQHTRGRDCGNHRLRATRCSRRRSRGRAGRRTAERPNIPYEGSKLNRKLQIVNLLDLEAEAQKILPPGGFGYISGGSGANWTRRENTEAFSRVQIEPHGAERRRQGRSHDRNPGIEAVDAGLHSADGQPWPRPRREGGGDREGRGRGRHADDDLDGVEPEPGGDRVAQSRAEVVPVLCAERPRLYPRAASSAPRPPATPRSRRRWTMSGPIRARRTSAAGS